MYEEGAVAELKILRRGFYGLDRLEMKEITVKSTLVSLK